MHQAVSKKRPKSPMMDIAFYELLNIFEFSGLVIFWNLMFMKIFRIFFSFSTRLKEHRWIHSDYKPYKCKFSDCELAFRHKNHLKHHEAKVHGAKKDFECDLCHRYVTPLCNTITHF
jgi:hypothetical protein